jgi:DNA-binding MarR family transcriptional regulator
MHSSSAAMSNDALLIPEACNCLAVRQAARQVTQFYDTFLTPVGLRATQFSILAKLQRLGPLRINALAAELVMDRTTLGRTIQPLVRRRLIAIVRGNPDRRCKELHLTELGAERLREAVKYWLRAQDRFAEIFGSERTADLCALLHAVSASELV